MFCCVPSGLPAGLPQLVIDPTSRVTYPSTKLVECTVLLGVAALLLPHQNLTGRLDGVDFSSMGTSLTRLDVGGMAPAVLPLWVTLCQQPNSAYAGACLRQGLDFTAHLCIPSHGTGV